MATSVCLKAKLPVAPPFRAASRLSSQRNLAVDFKRPRACISSPMHSKSSAQTRNRVAHITKAIEESQEERAESKSESESASSAAAEEERQPGEENLGAEIKKAMMERKKAEEEGRNLWSGVAEEVGEIEWPPFGRVLGITGVVLGVIAGSSVVLLTVNAVLAELSDRVFAGEGLQDFFG